MLKIATEVVLTIPRLIEQVDLNYC